jgi:glycosyltransferase involved in cell wall biosynthesis
VPVVSSAGDVVGERAAAAGAGISVPIGDAEAAGDALVALLGDAPLRASARLAAGRLAEELAWPRVLQPLVRWLDDPRVAADRVSTDSWGDALRSVVRAARAARARPGSAA